MKRAWIRDRFVVVAGIAVLVFTAFGEAEAVDDARLDQLMKIIEQQQQMIESQAQTLQSLKSEVESLRQQSNANASAVAAQAVQVREQEQKVNAVEERVDAVATAPTSLPSSDENYVQSGEPKISLTISGQVNRALLAYGDGKGSDVFNVDNNNSGTRFRFLGEGRVTDDFTIGTAIELQPQVNSSTAVNQDNPNTGLSTDLRRAELIFTSKKFGRFYLGKGWTASDSTSEVDLSGTDVVAYSSVSDMAGGLFFRNRDTNTFGPTVGASFTNVDGQGRQNRLRYDTPIFYGFSAAGSWTSGGAWDTALRYANDFGPVKAAAAIAYGDGSSIGQRQQQVNGSVSLLHETGLNLTAAAGSGGNKDNDLGARKDSTFWYVKAGYIGDFFDFGTTNFSVDGGQSFNVSQNDDQGSTVGFGVVQNLEDFGTQFYAGYRWHKLTSPAAQFRDINAGMAGARVKF